MAYNALIKLILQLACNAGELGFKKKQALESLGNSLPSSKDSKAQSNYLSHVLSKMSDDGLISPKGRTWYITEKGLIELNR